MTDVLVACVGNVFHGDDGFGVEVARRILMRGAPSGARVVDFGIRGVDLALALSGGVRAAVLVDAAARGGVPGTLYVLAPNDVEAAALAPEGHGMHPAKAIDLARRLGGVPEVIRIVACEPETLGGDDGRVGLSPCVEAAVDAAIALVGELVDELRESSHA